VKNLRSGCALLQAEKLEGVVLRFGVALQAAVIFVPYQRVKNRERGGGGGLMKLARWH
jgi:hypothetical protein